MTRQETLEKIYSLTDKKVTPSVAREIFNLALDYNCEHMFDENYVEIYVSDNDDSISIMDDWFEVVE